MFNTLCHSIKTIKWYTEKINFIKPIYSKLKIHLKLERKWFFLIRKEIVSTLKHIWWSLKKTWGSPIVLNNDLKCYSACMLIFASIVSDFSNTMDCSPLGSSVLGILQARILEWIAMSSSRGSSQHRDQTCISYVFCTGRWGLYHWATWKGPIITTEQVFLFLSQKSGN